MLTLVKPHIRYKKQYQEMMHAWDTIHEKPETWVLQQDYSDFPALVLKFEELAQGIHIPAEYVPCSTFWAHEDSTDILIGAVNIRQALNDDLLFAWGNIGYEVRPDERRKGYATQMLHLALNECKRLNLDTVLLGCYKDNAASARTILKNGGILENEVNDPRTGKIIQRYWITLKSSS